MLYPLQRQEPRRFSACRCSQRARRQMHNLCICEADLRYAFTYGMRIRKPGKVFIVVRLRDMPSPDRKLDRVVQRNGIVLVLNQHGWIVDLSRDLDAGRKLRRTGTHLMARAFRTRLG